MFMPSAFWPGVKNLSYLLIVVVTQHSICKKAIVLLTNLPDSNNIDTSIKYRTQIESRKIEKADIEQQSLTQISKGAITPLQLQYMHLPRRQPREERNLLQGSQPFEK